MKNLTFMKHELNEAANVLERQQVENAEKIRKLAIYLQKREPNIIVTCARGSSDHAASFAKTIFESRLGLLVAAYAPSMSSIYETQFRSLENSVFLSISQSGASPDLISSINGANEAGALTVTIVNEEDSPAAKISDVVIPMCAGKEYAVAATKTFIASMGVLISLLAEWQNDNELRMAYEKSPIALNLAKKYKWSQAFDTFENVQNLFVLGRSLTFGIAGEAALKLKETCSIHAESYSAAEVKHGPMALVKDGFPILMFPPFDKARYGFNNLATEFSQRGAKVFAVAPDIENTIALKSVANLHPLISPMAQIASFYNFAEELSRKRGLNPDAPKFLQKVTHTH